jgi:hypothetical protein
LEGQDNRIAIEPDIRMKWNFWSKLSPGHYHRLAVQAKLGVPLGPATSYILDNRPAGNGSDLLFIKPRAIPTIDLIYSRATSRFVYGADLEYSMPTADRNGLRIGDLKKASLDGEYAFWRGEKKGEASFVTGAMVRHFGRTHGGGPTFADTGGSDVALSGGIQYAPTPSLAFEASFTSDVWSAMRAAQPRMGNSLVFGIRFLR